MVAEDVRRVTTVSAAFYELNTGKGFMMRGESDGERAYHGSLTGGVSPNKKCSG